MQRLLSMWCEFWSYRRLRTECARLRVCFDCGAMLSPQGEGLVCLNCRAIERAKISARVRQIRTEERTV